MSDYETRAQTFGLAGAEELKTTLASPDTVLLDVRRIDEIEASGKFEKDGHKYVQVPCTPNSVEELSKSLTELLPNKQGKTIDTGTGVKLAIQGENLILLFIVL